MKQLEYNVEELHRGEWIPLEVRDEKGKKKGQKVVKITEEEAKTMNIDSKKVGVRYVLKEDDKDEKDVMKMNKGEQEAKAKELGVEFGDEHTNQATRGAFLKETIESQE